MNAEKRNSCRIARRADQQGARPSARNQAEVEKCATGTNSSHPQAPEDNQNENSTQAGSLAADSMNYPKKQTRQKWTRDEYKQVVTAYYQAILEPSEGNNTKHTYRIWREMNTNVRPNIDANRLANVRGDILKNERLSDAENSLDQFFKNLQSVNDSPYIYIIRNQKTTNSNTYSSLKSSILLPV